MTFTTFFICSFIGGLAGFIFYRLHSDIDYRYMLPAQHYVDDHESCDPQFCDSAFSIPEVFTTKYNQDDAGLVYHYCIYPCGCIYGRNAVKVYCENHGD